MPKNDYTNVKAPTDPWDRLWFTVCNNCGSVVYNAEVHDKWHADGSP